MKKYTQYFIKASETSHQFGLLTKENSFSERNEPIEVYVLTTLSLVKQHCKAISNLLDENLYITTMIVLRNIMELSFNLKWIYDAEDEKEKLATVYQLEGTAFSALDKEVKMMEEDANTDKLVWDEHMFKEKKETLQKAKKIYPELVRKNRNGIDIFREAPPFALRMEKIYRLKFYNIYRFLSSFVHPSPILREFTLIGNYSNKTPTLILESLFPELIKDSLAFIYGILEISDKIFSNRFPDKQNQFEKFRMEYFNLIKDIIGNTT